MPAEFGTRKLRIALAQINTTVGDISGNTAKIIDYTDRVRTIADIVVFPELAVCGYPPEDLLLKPSFVQDNAKAIQQIAEHTIGITAVVGFVSMDGDIHNSAAVLCDGSVAGVTDKIFLPNYGVFDEDRYFGGGQGTSVYELSDVKFGVEICEDIWYADGPHAAQSMIGGAHLIIDINSSPFYAGKWKSRERMLGTRASDNACAIVYLNAVGGQDELVYDGHSLVLDASGDVVFRCKAFEEQLAIVELDLAGIEHQRLVDPRRRKAKHMQRMEIEVESIPLSQESCVVSVPLNQQSEFSNPPGDLEEIYKALVTGTRDYVHKNKFKEVVLGLSGGIDSAIVACIAVDALGADMVRVLIMPSEFSSNETQSDAQIMAENLGIRYDYIPISEVFGAYKHSLESVFDGRDPDVAEENLQARIRGNMLMALSNKLGCLVLTTGNKSEMACGYSTLYGDMAGGFAVIKDVPKTLVYQLSHYRNLNGHPIPDSILDRAPSAELRLNQTDQDSLPPYDMLDQILELYVEDDRSVQDMIGMGFDEATVRRIVSLVDRNEYKRRQAAPGVKITHKAFGRDRRLPITNGYREA